MAVARLSERLISIGYYDDGEKPRVSYKENLNRVFQRRRRSHQFGTPTSDLLGTCYVDSSGYQTPTSSNTSFTSIADSSGLLTPTCSDISDTSIDDGWETPTPAELSSTPVPAQTEEPSDKSAVLVVYGNNEQTSQKSLPGFSLRNIVMFFFVILLCFAASLNPAGCFYQIHAMNKPKAFDQECLRLVQAKLKQVEEELVYLKHRLLPQGFSMPNFALESQGARVIHAHPSKSYQSPTQPPLVVFMGMPVWYSLNSPRTVIKGHTEELTPGRCWAFAGQQGYLFISLSQPIIISHVTLGHMAREHAPPGSMHSAPRHFSVFGFLAEDGEGTHLGTFEYDPEGESFQTFELPGPTRTVFRYVMLEIMSNWGHPEYTCVYSFKVHGGNIRR